MSGWQAKRAARLEAALARGRAELARPGLAPKPAPPPPVRKRTPPPIPPVRTLAERLGLDPDAIEAAALERPRSLVDRLGLDHCELLRAILPDTIDGLIRRSGLRLGQVQSALLLLEAHGRARLVKGRWEHSEQATIVA